MSQQTAGILSFSIDGIAFDVIDATWTVNGIKSDFLVSMTGIDGTQSYTFMPGEIDATLRFNPSVPPSNFVAYTNVTIVIQTRAGFSVTARNCLISEPPKTDPKENTFEVKFQSPEIVEVQN